MNSALRVWLVDDDASIRWVLERALKSGGMTPRVFEAAELALEALRGDAPDVLLTDIRMPGLSGLDLVRRLHETRPQLPIIVMTAHADLDNAVSAYESGAFEYLPKPFDIDQVIEKQRAAVCLFEAPATQCIRSSESSLLVPEQLRLEQLGRNRRSIEGNERFAGSRAVFM